MARFVRVPHGSVEAAFGSQIVTRHSE